MIESIGKNWLTNGFYHYPATTSLLIISLNRLHRSAYYEQMLVRLEADSMSSTTYRISIKNGSSNFHSDNMIFQYFLVAKISLLSTCFAAIQKKTWVSCSSQMWLVTDSSIQSEIFTAKSWTICLGLAMQPQHKAWAVVACYSVSNTDNECSLWDHQAAVAGNVEEDPTLGNTQCKVLQEFVMRSTSKNSNNNEYMINIIIDY